ncbi:radical SAM protein [Roseomonas sp. HF4]|uniref:B12-binding domain-containing radical SAM protein n=1 Tax=Roseomonas sp. HF4 TaxID=2562313 RepID=UPI001484D8F9|nr:radical SAM protein [Roseomonas sp. HF4]
MRDRPRILLIGPTALDYGGKPIKQRRLHLPGLTLPMLAAATPTDCEVRLISETVDEIPFDEHWDLVGITGMGSGIVRAWQIADAFRARGTTVVIGGIAASLGEPDWTLQHADALVTGEAEETWPRVVADFAAGRLQRHYRMTRPPPIEDLPEPRYDLMNARRLGVWRPVQATRGCPFQCSYCSITAFFSGRYRKRPIEAVVRDVRLAKRTGTRHIAFIDDNIGVDWDYSGRLFEALIPENIIWMSQCSLHIADRPDMLRLASRSGCRMLSIGIESTNPDSLAEVDKAWNRPERYIEALRTIRSHGIDVSTEMIIGLDSDDASVFQRTYDFIIQAGISVPRVHILTPVPGTPLFRQMVESGRISSLDFARYSGGQAVFTPRRLSPEDLQKGYWDLYERLFSWTGILRRTWRNNASLGLFMRAVVLATNLHYRNHIHHRITPGIV